MKRFFTLILGVALIASMHSCKTIEENNGQIVEKKLKITAVIDGKMETRVSYNVDNTANTITPAWEVGDEVFGFDSNSNTFTISVTATGEEGATLEPDGSYSPTEGTTVYAIYAPGYSVSDLNDNTLSVNLAAQGGVLNASTPALMCATGSVNADNELELHFANQTAIIGVKKFQLNGVTAATNVTSMSVNGVITTGMFQVNDGVLELVPGTETGSITATHPNGGWATDANGICEAGVYFAAMPTTEAPEITLNAVAGGIKYANVSAITASTMEPGKYYYMSKKLGGAVADVDGVPYLTIDEAFAVAKKSNTDATITLLSDCEANSVLYINEAEPFGTGNVTLDLGIYTLTGVTSASSININNRVFTVKGTTGKITSSSSDKYPLYAAGSSIINIEGGTVESTGYRCLYCGKNATINISGGNITTDFGYGIYCLGNTNISGGRIYTGITGTSSNPRAAVIATGDSAVLNITGGTLETINNYTAGFWCYGEGAQVTVSNGEINAKWIYFQNNGSNTVSITGGTFTSSSYGVYLNGANARSFISGGSFNSSGNPVVYVGHGTIDITGGVFSRTGGNVVKTANDDSFANINGGYFTNTTDYAAIIASKGTINFSNGFVNSIGVNPVSADDAGNAYVTGGHFNKPIQPQFAKDSVDNNYVNILNADPATSETYPFTVSPSSVTPKVATVNQGSYTWENGTFESAIKNADVRAAANGESTITIDTDCSASTTSFVSGDNTYAVVLDLNGHTVSSSVSPVISSAGLFNLQDSDSGSGGEVSTSGATALEVTGGASTVYGGALVSASNAVNVSSGSLAVFGGALYGSTDDIISAATATIYGGYFNHDPSSWLASSASATNGSYLVGGRTYNYKVEASVATVNGVGYSTLDDAAEATVNYDGSDETVILQLQDNLTYNQPLNLTHASKPVTLDLNGHILSTTVQDFIHPTSGTLTITDSQDKVGKITSDSYQVIYSGSTSNITISNCIIEGTLGEATGNNAQPVILAAGSSITTFTNATVYSTGKQTAIRLNNANCTVNINDSEISSGIASTESFNAIANNNGTLNVNSGSLYAKSGAVIIHSGGGNNTISNINGGYFYGGGTQCLRANTYGSMTINGGYMNIQPSGNKYVCGTEKQIVPLADPVTHAHQTTGTTLSYGYSVE
ncbi:MAG: hypothetical protein IJT26_03685 [Bacteroidales bacterium]|nr:hypothetical protein [Bacteroidales bacterium]